MWRELHKANKGAALVLPETLGAIAKATYGDAMKYKTIFERNADRLVNANTILRGTGHCPVREVSTSKNSITKA